MQITLNESDISKALTGFLESMGINLEGKKVTTAFTAGRGVNGNTATLTIEEGNDAPTQTTPKAEENIPHESETMVTEEAQTSLDLTEDTLVFEEG